MRRPRRHDSDGGRAARCRDGRRARLIELPPSLEWWRGEPGGAQWLDSLPGIAAELAERWSLELEPPFHGHASLTIPAGDLVLKINPDEPESEHEADALERWNGRGAARLVARADEHRACLLERLRPGIQGWALPDSEATAIAADILEELWIAAAEPFRTLEEMAAYWVDFLPRHWEEVGRSFEWRLVEEAVSFLRDAGPTQREAVLLHQDFQGSNFLLSERGWLAIDPKPLVGEREFDVASLIRDRRPTTREAMERRLDYLVDRLALDRERARGWAIAHALAWDGDSEMAECARLLATA